MRELKRRGAVADALPVLMMPDGGMGEDFLHIAGLLQVGVANGTMRPWLLVGVENIERRRDLTEPTSSLSERKIATRVGGSQAFRQFIRRELLPQVHRRFRVSNETAIVGESLAGLFVMEIFAVQPDLFNVYSAIDPEPVVEPLAVDEARPGPVLRPISRREISLCGMELRCAAGNG